MKEALLGTCGACEASVSIEPQSTMHIANPLDRLHSLSTLGPSIPATVYFPESLALMVKHFRWLFGQSLGLALLWLAAVALPGSLLSRYWMPAAKNPAMLTIATVGLSVAALFVTAHIVVVLVRICLQVVRYGRDSESRHLLASHSVFTAWTPRPLSVTLRVGGLLVLCTFCLVLTLVGAIVWMIAAAMIFETDAATVIGMAGAALLVFSVAVLLQWILWPAVFLIADERCDLLTAMTASAALIKRHAKMSLALMAVYAALATIGSLFFYVGQILVMPAAFVPMAMGYLAMTGGTEVRPAIATSLPESHPLGRPLHEHPPE